jgi:hypothetical protein
MYLYLPFSRHKLRPSHSSSCDDQDEIGQYCYGSQIRNTDALDMLMEWGIQTMSIDFCSANLTHVEDGGRRRNIKTVRQPSQPMTACGTNTCKPIFFGFLLNALVTLSGNFMLIIATNLWENWALGVGGGGVGGGTPRRQRRHLVCHMFCAQ